MTLRQLGLRALTLVALVVGLCTAFDWAFAPRLPLAPGTDLRLFPLVAINLNAVLRGAMPAAIGYAVYTLSALTLSLSVLLATRLALQAGQHAAVRRLVQALALGSLTVAYFWFLRDLAPWQSHLSGIAPALDAVAMVAGCFSLVALVACFRDYPEPLTQEFLERGADHSLAWQERLVHSKRSGQGVWRLWGFLPPEHFGPFGRSQRPELRGAIRWLRSRELLWFAAFAGVCAYGLGVGGWMAGHAWPVRLVGVGVVAVAMPVLLDPLLQARIDAGMLAGLRGAKSNRLVSGEMALHRFAGSPLGLALLVSAALAVTWMWHTGGPLVLLASALQLAFVLLLVGHAMSLLLMNWRHGTEEHRRAIGWICLGTLGAAVVWIAAILLVGIFGIGHWLLGGDSKRLLAQVIVLGPPTIALAFVVALWASTLYRGSFDAGLALRRGTGVAMAGVVLTSLFVAVEGLMTSQVVVRLGMPNQTGAVIAGTVTAMVIAPVRSRIDRQIAKAVQRWMPADYLAAAKRSDCVVAFSDLSGYTRLSEQDEKEALTLATLLHQLGADVARQHGGRLVKSLGDAVLLVFADADEALLAVRALHRRFDEESERRSLESLPVHTGMHRGEVVVAADGDVFGASVNLASRLQGLAGADEVVVSTTLADAVARAGLVAETLPARRFKNLAETTDCLRFRAGQGK